MERKRLFIILGAISVIFSLVWLTTSPLIKNLRASNDGSDQSITDITLCDMDARALCVVTFGRDITDRMIINFQLPNEGYPAFYVKGSNKGVENRYQCEVAKAVPTSVYCAGNRTPLGEAIDIEVYAADSDLLIARGTIRVAAMIVLTVPINSVVISEGKLVTLTPTPFPLPTATIQTGTTPVVVFTPTPDAAYPGP